MRLLNCFLFSTVLLPFLSSAQSAISPLYREDGYIQASRNLGINNADELYTRWYRYGADSSYTLKKVFADESRTKLLSKTFYKSNVPDGPFYGYSNDSLAIQGSYQNGKLDGERLAYQHGKLLQRAFFTAGLRSGSWEVYNAQGKVNRKLTFNDNGQLISDEKLIDSEEKNDGPVRIDPK